MNHKKSLHIFAIAALGEGLSGGDRIFIEFARRLSKNHKVVIHVWDEGYKMCRRQGLLPYQNLTFEIIDVNFWCRFGFIVCYLVRIVIACFKALFIKLKNNNSFIVYSASEFWMDALPAFILKLRFPKIKWVAAWFQTAPNPMVGFTKGKRENPHRLSAFYHWFMQLPIKPIIENFADLVLVNNELERKEFSNLDKQNKTMVILGAVNIKEIEKFIKKAKKWPKIYEAVFQGRFHPQKGVGELIEIWKLVTNKKPASKLAMIGDGPLMYEVKNKIKELKLENNIDLFGYVFDGPLKYKIFSQSKLVVHPAFYDSGGMASAEGMAFRIPCVGFDLESYRSYYPEGMIKVKIGDLNKFANEILALLENEKKREQLGYEAQNMINKNWSWDQRVDQLLSKL